MLCYAMCVQVLKIARVYKGSVAAAGGVITPGDRIAAINGTRLAGGGEGGVLKQAMDELSQIPDGVDIALELESDTLLAGWMQKKGEKGLKNPSMRLYAMLCYAMLCYAMVLCYAMLGEKGLKSWQRRFFTLVWCAHMLCYAMLCYAVRQRRPSVASLHRACRLQVGAQPRREGDPLLRGARQRDAQAEGAPISGRRRHNASSTEHLPNVAPPSMQGAIDLLPYHHRIILRSPPP